MKMKYSKLRVTTTSSVSTVLKSIMVLLVLMFYSVCVKSQIPEDLKRILTSTLSNAQNQYNFKGLSVAVSYPRQGTWTAAVGESASGKELQVNELIGIGSSTKTFISAAILLLEEDGLLSIEDTIGKWIQGYQYITGDITIKQLLNHTSGLYPYTTNTSFWNKINEDVSKNWTDEELLRTFLKPQVFAPGKGLEYNNTGYIVAGMIIKEVTGKPWHKVVRERIIDPLKLENTFIPPYEQVDGEIANFWTILYGNKLKSMGNYGEDDLLPSSINTVASAAGSIISTAEDNALFYKYLLAGVIIKKSTLREKMMDFINAGNSGFGLGIFKYQSPAGDDLFAHEGVWLGQVCSNLSDTANGISISVLSNQDSLSVPALDDVAFALYMRTLNYYRQHASIEESNINQMEFSTYPNPIHSDDLQIQIKPHKSNIDIIEIQDAKGTIIESIPGNNIISSKVQLNTLHWEPGVYYIKIRTRENVSTFSKVLKL
jgi:D-alanyl-D-alanine carboxypeptidase